MADVLINGTLAGPITTHTFANINGPHSIAASFRPAGDSHFDENGLLRINLATESELMALPLLGVWHAAMIVAYREANGPYDSIWGLALAGISGWMIGQLAPHITL